MTPLPLLLPIAAPEIEAHLHELPHCSRSRADTCLQAESPHQHWPLVQDQPRRGRGQEWGRFSLGLIWRRFFLSFFFSCLLNDKGLT